MNENLDPSNENFSNEDLEIDKALRPLSFSDFRGQNQVIENLKVFVKASAKIFDVVARFSYDCPRFPKDFHNIFARCS